jgi:dynein heavy chain, axonemal
MFKILDCFYQPFWDTEILKITAEDVEAFEEYSEELFFYALVWSLGVTTDEAGRETFEAKLREIAGKDNKHIMPKSSSVYDFCFYM